MAISISGRPSKSFDRVFFFMGLSHSISAKTLGWVSLCFGSRTRRASIYGPYSPSMYKNGKLSHRYDWMRTLFIVIKMIGSSQLENKDNRGHLFLSETHGCGL